jgi:hypothetical protein
MNSFNKIAIASALLLTSSIAFACDYPGRPKMPDGATASKDDLLVAKTDVQDYMAAVDEYLRCVEADEKEAAANLDNPSKDELKRRDSMLSKKFDAANEEKELVGEQFNQQIRAYNQKLKDSKE